MVGAMTFTGMIQLGGNTPGATVPDGGAGSGCWRETPGAPALSAGVPEASAGAGTVLGAEFGSVPGAPPGPSLMAQAEIWDNTFEAKWMALSHHNSAQPMPTTHDAPDDASIPAPVAQNSGSSHLLRLVRTAACREAGGHRLKVTQGHPGRNAGRGDQARFRHFRSDSNFMKAVARSSGFDPKQRTGSYIGLFQLSEYEFNKFGSGQIGIHQTIPLRPLTKVITEGILFEWVTHRKPTLSDLYLIHQQGWEGAAEHISQPDRIAWKSMCATSEGREKGEKWCKRAIWRNTLPAIKQAWKSVDKLTSEAFVGMWRARVARILVEIHGHRRRTGEPVNFR